MRHVLRAGCAGLGLALALALAGLSLQSPADDYARVVHSFRTPGAEFRPAPLWVWNDRLTRGQVETQLRDFKERGIGGVFIHPRPGLITPYLSKEWLSLCRHAVETGRRLGLKVWIYDENSYPSGFAGGRVPAVMPEALRSGLRMKTSDKPPNPSDPPPLILLRRAGDEFAVISPAQARDMGAGEYFIFDVVRSEPSPWYGGFDYVDLMRPEVTEKFLELTLDAYRSTFGDEFGRTVPGVFQDEAEIAPGGGEDTVNYTPALWDAFQARWGYDLRVHLPSLFQETGEWRRIRHNYYATLLDLFIKGWAVPYRDYCQRNDLIFTGHYWEHEWPRPRVGPDSLALMTYSHMPGIDVLMNDYQTDHAAQFGNARSVREVRSAANQLARRRVLSETYGASGWDLSFLDQKRIGDWEYALGVNFLNPHLSYVTIKGARKRDHPLSFSYHEPWWPAYGLLADYFGRLSVALSAGRQDNRIVVLEPTSSAWMYYSPRNPSPRFEDIASGFQDFVNRLEASQVEYDLASESTLKDLGAAESRRLRIGQAVYDLVVLPPGLENVNRETGILLKAYLAQGGRVLSLVAPPRLVDGRPDPSLGLAAMTFKDGWRTTNGEAAAEVLAGLGLQDVVFGDRGGEANRLFHQHRKLEDADLVFLCNTSASGSVSGRFTGPGKSAERWDALTGRVSAYPSAPAPKGQAVDFDLPPGGSLLLCLRRGKLPASPGSEAAFRVENVEASSSLAVRPVGPNVLTLDYCDLTLDGREEKGLYFYEAQQKVFRRYGFARNPWDSGVQFKTEILDKNHFGPDTGFEAVYRFDVSPGVPKASLRAVVEQPDLFKVSLNGRPVKPLRNEWWLDHAFGVFPIGPAVRPGVNRLTVKASPFTVFSELEPVYVLGEFGLQGKDRGFGLVPAAGMRLGSWKDQGRPFYAAGVSYEKTYSILDSGPGVTTYTLVLGEWRGAVSEVLVDGRSCGYAAFPPYEVDVTRFLTPGRHKVSVIVFGTLKNTLGPHHADPPRGMAWPSAFQKGASGGLPPGSEYDLRAYGLVEDFRLEARKRAE
jgi:hypothetical protein